MAVSSAVVLPADARLVSFMPHMHLRGKDFKYTVTRPGEPPQVGPLGAGVRLRLADLSTSSSEPMVLPKGTRIDCLAHFDNSSNNPYNPDPNKLVRWGEQTFEEMMIGYVDMDVPVGRRRRSTGPELRPAAVRIGQNAIQALRRATDGRQRPGSNTTKARVALDTA